MRSRLFSTRPRGKTARLLLVGALLFFGYGKAQAQIGDYGDAPEGATAYPSLGVLGVFPTCLGGPSDWIWHMPHQPGDPNGWFGPTVDYEPNGNAGICPPPPYENDECVRPVDNDAGLLIVGTWTIDAAMNVVPCPGSTGTLLGPACGTATWGANLDMEVHNNTNAVMFMNLLVDWDQNGFWGGSSVCGGAGVPEWTVVDFPIPPGFNGLVSALGPSAFQIGPKQDWVWLRFALTEIPIFPNQPNWNGRGIFDRGETEDYLVKIDAAAGGSFGDYGDAPEGGIAYPGTGVIGQFPTCVNVGPQQFIYHIVSNDLWLGPSVDGETDGNAGACGFPPYDEDECSRPLGDAGLVNPAAFTINAAMNIVSCDGNTQALGPACGMAMVGPDFDVEIHNNSNFQASLNVLVDWDRNGLWSGGLACPVGPSAPEHLIQNVPVPAFFNGFLSMLIPGFKFSIPSSRGFVWTRVSLTDINVPVGWNGEGFFHDGETEDYLLRIAEPAPGDFGDAPEGSLAYPSLGVIGAFPTCVATGPALWVYHASSNNVYLGPFADAEQEGNAGPPCGFPPYDQDECGLPGGDSGLLTPDAFTIDGSPNEVPCNPGAIRPLGLSCNQSKIGTDLDIDLHNNTNSDMFFNLLVDWNEDGQWQGVYTCAAGLTSLEHLLQNVVVPAGFNGPLSALTGPLVFNVVSTAGNFVWVRATIGERMVVADWDGSGWLEQGETEDYLLYVGSLAGTPEEAAIPVRPELGPVLPNPSSGLMTIHYATSAPGPVRISVFDVAGRQVTTADLGTKPAGRYTWSWSGETADGSQAATGLYIVRLETAAGERTMKVTRIQ